MSCSCFLYADISAAFCWLASSCAGLLQGFFVLAIIICVIRCALFSLVLSLGRHFFCRRRENKGPCIETLTYLNDGLWTLDSVGRS